MKLLITLTLIFIPGCFFARVDWEGDRKSATVWTLGKNYAYADPNTLVESVSDKFRVTTIYGTGGTK